MRWWHYTKGVAFLGIFDEGQIRRPAASVNRWERRTVWFSSRETWEPTATTRVVERGVPRYASVEEMVRRSGYLVRLEVPDEIARHTWAQHRQIGQIDPRVADALEQAARGSGADPAQWRASYHDVPFAYIQRIEASTDGDVWQPVSELDGADFIISQEFVESLRRFTGSQSGR